MFNFVVLFIFCFALAYAQPTDQVNTLNRLILTPNGSLNETNFCQNAAYNTSIVLCTLIDSKFQVTTLNFSDDGYSFGLEADTLASFPALDVFIHAASSFFNVTNLLDTIASNVSVIDLRHAAFWMRGSIPDSIGRLTKLRELYMNSERTTIVLDGTLPDAMGDLESLEILQFENINMTSQVPQSLENLSNLKRFYIGTRTGSRKTGFFGEFPALNDASLDCLFIRNTMLGGEFPSTLIKVYNASQFRNNNFAALKNEDDASALGVKVCFDQCDDEPAPVRTTLPQLANTISRATRKLVVSNPLDDAIGALIITLIVLVACFLLSAAIFFVCTVKERQRTRESLYAAAPPLEEGDDW